MPLFLFAFVDHYYPNDLSFCVGFAIPDVALGLVAAWPELDGFRIVGHQVRRS
jgi:hypothetical protein